MTNQRNDPAQYAPTLVPTAIDIEGGVMPGASESSNAGAFPRTDATRPNSLPRAIADSLGDPTGPKNRDQLLALAQAQGIEGAATMNRGELADVLKATMSPEALVGALDA
jgi:hypothetical protein